jgi:uncharacterized protein
LNDLREENLAKLNDKDSIRRYRVIFHEFVLTSLHHDMPFSVDAQMEKTGDRKPIVIFIHGFKGFKDWGTFNLVAKKFAEGGFAFVKLNLSHNGTSVGHPQEFVDLEAFAQNNFSIELDDLSVVLDYITSQKDNPFYESYNTNKIYLMGHSRGGSLAILKACEDPRVSGVVTWSAVSSYPSSWTDDELELWKRNGLVYVYNKRTEQRMPLYYQVVEDYFENIERLEISKAIGNLQAPLFLIHAKDDKSVSVGMAIEIQSWDNRSKLLILEQGGHTFGGYHPYYEENLPAPLEKVVEESIKFFRNLE